MRILIVFLIMFFTVPRAVWAVEDDLDQSRNKKNIIHVVQKGETLSSILRTYNVSLDKFLKTNKSLNNTNLAISIGQQLVIVKKDRGSATDGEIVSQVKLYLDSHGFATENQEKKDEIKPDNLIQDLTTADKYDEDNRPNISLLPISDDIKVTLLLPLMNSEGVEDKAFEAFYKGAILALSDLKSSGISASVDVFDTDHSLETVNRIIADGDLNERNLVIGPVYKDQFAVVADYMRGRGTVLVSPLSYVDSEAEYIFQLAPSHTTRYNKLQDFFEGKKIHYYESNSNDTTFLKTIEIPLSRAALVDTLNLVLTDDEIKEKFSAEMDNIVVVSAKNKSDIELIVSKIATLKRGMSSSFNISVLGSPDFAKVEEFKRADFFKSNTYFITSYHQDRLDSSSIDFETQYIDMFGEQPNIFSYRAYDAVILFISALHESGSDFYNYTYDQLMQVLQASYRFVLEDGKLVNQEWMLVNYKPNYTISIK